MGAKARPEAEPAAKWERWGVDHQGCYRRRCASCGAVFHSVARTAFVCCYSPSGIRRVTALRRERSTAARSARTCVQYGAIFTPKRHDGETYLARCRQARHRIALRAAAAF